MAKTALQKHVAFFDADGDGQVGLGETYRGMRALGLGRGTSAFFAPLVVGLLGVKTQGHPRAVSVERIDRGLHPYDTGVFGERGGLDERRLHELVAAAGGDAVTFGELRAAMAARASARPARGYGPVSAQLANVFSAVEARVLVCLAADVKKRVGRRDVPAVSRRALTLFYEGELFPMLARRRRLAEAWGLSAATSRR